MPFVPIVLEIKMYIELRKYNNTIHRRPMCERIELRPNDGCDVGDFQRVRAGKTRGI